MASSNHHHHPLKLLEISVLSAQHLAPVSKLLRTYAVAWFDPDQKLTTKVDHHGHTNPTWNYRFVFRVNDDFLNSAASAITIEIYNVSWLRDIPIGTVTALITDILPPSLRSQKNSTIRLVPLQIRRPSGSFHGVLNLGVNLIDCTRRSMPLDSQLSPATTIQIDVKEDKNKENIIMQPNDAKMKKLWRSRSERSIVTASVKGEYSGSKGGSDESRLSFGKCSRSKATTRSSASYMRPIPSEVAAFMAKGLYSDVGSSIFENWTVVGDNDENLSSKHKVVMWKKKNDDGDQHDRHHLSNLKKKKKKNSKSIAEGLLSCFGITCGYECNIMCGTPKNKNKSKNKNMNMNMFGANHSSENVHLLHR
ncbi:hypothetical protein LOK49_LG07G01733 [Camellia lanceoleosa]|uniref:Uncharacterized protein n=1 Tax=Camellia lanceoleosa TaxID=1840588 RepID=A0ACC0H038_9ERIC|nr:hypothetical protein LOK49_LG07G01733 [Camellia lanceoleosa]